MIAVSPVGVLALFQMDRDLFEHHLPRELEPKQIRLPEFEIDQETEARWTRTGLAICGRLEQFLETLTPPRLDETPIVRWKAALLKLKTIWPEHDGHRVKPRFSLTWISPDLDCEPKRASSSARPSEAKQTRVHTLDSFRVKFEPMRATDEADFSYVKTDDGYEGELTFGLRSLLEASSADTLAEAVNTLYEHVIHETAHLGFPGTSTDEQGGGTEGAVKYLSHPGEMRAYAKEYAFKYRREFPGEPFDLGKMRTIISTNDERNYLVRFADSQVQATYHSIADLSDVHAKVVDLTRRFVEHFDRLS